MTSILTQGQGMLNRLEPVSTGWTESYQPKSGTVHLFKLACFIGFAIRFTLSGSGSTQLKIYLLLKI